MQLTIVGIVVILIAVALLAGFMLTLSTSKIPADVKQPPPTKDPPQQKTLDQIIATVEGLAGVAEIAAGFISKGLQQQAARRGLKIPFETKFTMNTLRQLALDQISNAASVLIENATQQLNQPKGVSDAIGGLLNLIMDGYAFGEALNDLVELLEEIVKKLVEAAVDQVGNVARGAFLVIKIIEIIDLIGSLADDEITLVKGLQSLK